MKYGQKYQLALDGTIVDLDMPAPSVLTPSTTSFTTFKPPFLGTAGSVASQGIVLFSVRVALSRTRSHSPQTSEWAQDLDTSRALWEFFAAQRGTRSRRADQP
jgi:hypothetical protein